MLECNHACLQSLSGETLRLASANTKHGAQLDVSKGWNARQDAYFDVRGFIQMLLSFVQEAGR